MCYGGVMDTLTIGDTTYRVIGLWTDLRTGDQNMQLDFCGSVRQHRIKKEVEEVV